MHLKTTLLLIITILFVLASFHLVLCMCLVALLILYPPEDLYSNVRNYLYVIPFGPVIQPDSLFCRTHFIVVREHGVCLACRKTMLVGLIAKATPMKPINSANAHFLDRIMLFSKNIFNVNRLKIYLYLDAYPSSFISQIQ